MSDTHDEIRVLRVMVDELRAEAPPELAWDALEQRLLTSIAATERPMSRRAAAPGSALPRVLGFMAAAAAIALGISSVTGGGASELPSAAVPATHEVQAASVALAPGEAGERGQRDLSALRAGDVIESGDAPVTFARAGLAAWTLAPHSVARVRSMGDRGSSVGHTVALERGSIRAEVTPRDPAEGLVEAFAVEVGGTRVAVHGTVFSVTIEGDHAVVDVEHGAVAVGPVGNRGATTGHLLVGPSRAVFSLDGGRTARLVSRTPAPEPIAAVDLGRAPEPVHVAVLAAPVGDVAVVAPAPVAGTAVGAARAVQPAPAAAKPVAEAPVAVVAPELPLLTVAAVSARINRCFQSAYEAGPSSVELSISGTAQFVLNADGTVLRRQFESPLKPEVATCIGAATGGRFAEGGRTVAIPFSFRR